MTIRVALDHQTTYHYEQPVLLGPHVLRLRPAVHSRTPVTHYHLSIKPENDTLVTVAVIDSGIGIPPAKVDEIFEPFTQLDASASRRYGGTGLGLTISRRLAEAQRLSR